MLFVYIVRVTYTLYKHETVKHAGTISSLISFNCLKLFLPRIL